MNLPVVQDGRQVIPVLNIQQWFSLPDNERVLILQNIKLKDRLYHFLDRKGQRKQDPNTEAERVPCFKCEGTGYVTVEPRHPGIHPSQLPQPCLLKIWREMNGEESRESIEPRLRLIFDVGHAIHGMLQTYGLQGAWGPVYKPEIAVNADAQQLADELWIEGHADADNVLRIDDIPGHPYIYDVGIVHEYKSISTKQFEMLAKAKPDHKFQATIYAAVLDRPIVVYLYFSKNDSNLADFPVAFDGEIYAKIRVKCTTLLDHYNRQVPPEATVGYHCRDCPYLFNCPDGMANNRPRSR